MSVACLETGEQELMRLNSRERGKRAWGKQESFDVVHQSEGVPTQGFVHQPREVPSSTVKQEGCLAFGERSASRKLLSLLQEAFEQHNDIHMFLSEPGSLRSQLGLSESLSLCSVNPPGRSWPAVFFI